MSAADAQAEPTMEEILASIRRIISEDDVGGSPPASPAPEQHEEVLELSQPEPELPPTVAPDFDFDALPTEYEAEPQVQEEAYAEPSYDGIIVEDRWSDPEPAYTPEVAPIREPYQPPPPVAREPIVAFSPRGDDGLVSDPIAATTSQVFSKLAPSNVFPEIFASGNTVEALVVEMLKPMLKEWLDANLPRIVEDKVETEVARIARRSF
jgi:uncharacterized protein